MSSPLNEEEIRKDREASTQDSRHMYLVTVEQLELLDKKGIKYRIIKQ